MNAFVDYSARLVSTTAQAAWLVLFRETKPDGLATISQGQIGKLIGVSDRTARRAVTSLENAGLLTVVHRGKLGGKPSTYRVYGTPLQGPGGRTPMSDLNGFKGRTPVP